MKVCQVLAGVGNGGLEKHFADLCNRLAEYHEIHVIAHEKFRRKFDPNIIFHSLDLSKGRKNIIILIKLLQIIRKIKPDILHAHASKAVEMVAHIKFFIKHSIKTVATLHSKKSSLKGFEKFDYIIGVSNEILKDLKNPHRSVIYNGIQWKKTYKNDKYFLPFGIANKFVICAIGRLEKVKNFPVLINAIKELDIKLLIVGIGSEEKNLKKLTKDLKLEDKVIFTGFRNDVEDILVNSNLMVISSDKEGFSYVFVEALLNGVPIVSTDVSDNKRLIPERYIVPIKDPKRLTKVIKETITDYQNVKNDFKNSFMFAHKHFTLDAMIKAHLDVYKKVLH